jgi:hypothetical protein
LLAAGNQLTTALSALAARAAGKPGCSWRVAVTQLASTPASQDAGLGGVLARLNARGASEKIRVKHAVMQVGGPVALALGLLLEQGRSQPDAEQERASLWPLPGH